MVDTIDENIIAKKEYEYAGLGVRIGATILDFLITMPITLILSYYNLIYVKNLPLQIMIIIFGLLFKPLFEYYKGATPGKMLLKLKVVDINHESITMTETIIRNLPFIVMSILTVPDTVEAFSDDRFFEVSSYFEYVSYTQIQAQEKSFDISLWFSFILLAFIIGDIIAVLVDQKKRCLRDMMANTYVIVK